ncbi:hypothetical protein [Pontibacter sp. SGAir0037]|uniref:hypothetical protein n=1 Tax=Pontibacter sp. SGAir0037 TaxID=2571030 RepID=UPI0010CCCB4F|nr:hypothetical protein [Pontibacter sp. SGAir0037]QCR21117.1 hypothetical protein C1N53_01220 [Pontibacter sp. SGAir0037]
MKQIILFVITLTFLACNEGNQAEDNGNSEIDANSRNTTLVKIENRLDNWFEAENFTRSYSYCWISENDTLDFTIRITENVSDSSLALRFSHRKPVLFSAAMEKLNSCLPIIKQDFNLDKLGYFHFESPIYYRDMTTELSKSYENQFGKKNISYKQLNDFLMDSWLEEKVGAFLNQFNKSTKRYGIEKFHILEKEDYKQYIPNSDLSDYPSFSIHGMGVSVMINE